MTEKDVVLHKYGGLGNILLTLSSVYDTCKLVHHKVYDYELSNCMTLKGCTKVYYDGVPANHVIYINDYHYHNIHSRIRDFVEPTDYMKDMIEKYKYLLDGVEIGMSIRRGSYCEDSRQFKDERGDRAEHYFCSDEGLKKFKDIIRTCKGKVFISTDSSSTLEELKNEFGDKITYMDMPYTVGAEQDQYTSTEQQNLHKIYLKWFLLSMCPKLCITGGNNMVGFSTYGYTAAVYGRKPFHTVFN